MNRLGAVLMALAVVACGPRTPAAEQPRPQAVEIKDDQFSPEATVVGTKVIDSTIPATVKVWFIRSFIGKRSGEVTHQLYVLVSYTGERRRYEMASDDRATPLRFTPIERERGACSYGNCDYDENFGLDLSDTILRERAGSGFQVKVVAHSSDSVILMVAPGQILPQLAATDAYRRAHSLIGAKEPAPIAAPTPGRIGIHLTLLPPTLAPDLKLTPGVGLLVAVVGPGTAAGKAGIKAGDVMLEFNGKPTNAFPDLMDPLQTIPGGTAVPMVLWRANARVEVVLQL
jgi:membrane-associated protease RseP (regulator of RpoE activity)